MQWNTEPILRELWTGKCTIWNFVDTVDEDTKQTTQTMEKVHGLDDIPCRLSYRQVSDVTSKSEAPIVQLVIKLFLPRTIVIDEVEQLLEIPAGSVISVEQNGRTEWYDRSGYPAWYSNHQEIVLNIRKAYV